MKIDTAKAALEASSGKRRVRVAKAEAAADRLRQKLAKALAREAPRKRWTPADVIRMATMAGAGNSAGEIAETLGTTRGRVAAQLTRYKIQLVPKLSTEACVRLTMRKDTVAALARLAVERDVAVEVLMSSALSALAVEPVLVANLLDDEA